MCTSLFANWFNGGKTLVDGKSTGNLQDKWRIGGVFSLPIAKAQSLKFQLNAGTIKEDGLNYDIYSVTYQYVFF